MEIIFNIVLAALIVLPPIGIWYGLAKRSKAKEEGIWVVILVLSLILTSIMIPQLVFIGIGSLFGITIPIEIPSAIGFILSCFSIHYGYDKWEKERREK